MDVRLNGEQRQLRDAAAKLADDLGPGSVADLNDGNRRARLERAIDTAGWRTLRTDGASGVEVAIVAEEFGRGLIDVAFLGPVLADDLFGKATADGGAWTLAVGDRAIDARGRDRVLTLEEHRIFAAQVGDPRPGADLTRDAAHVTGAREQVGELSADELTKWQALAVTVTTADLLGIARGAQRLAVDYAAIREQYGKTIGSYQAVAHLLAENQALIEGSISVLRHAAWAVDELDPDAALRAARIAKVYTARATRTVCETSIQVHGGIGNTWDCLAHVYLRRALTSTELFPVRLEEIDLGLS
ncbi:acyl-CoA dehydrogenase family protein [Nocardia bovistercoris]|uniref:Acyl-CoA dehydrogenase n=1 Tax=Nocardia bovistercoris TaxID=2785916 RepID=A0A931N6F9_9NOCA|nr:acyl-CoA dehydrogenase family protein [Nocardia bovistercoris]MBH0780712.1 acyl-CoA dehydrogenase [Nocardia bovistercoris]